MFFNGGPWFQQDNAKLCCYALAGLCSEGVQVLNWLSAVQTNQTWTRGFTLSLGWCRYSHNQVIDQTRLSRAGRHSTWHKTTRQVNNWSKHRASVSTTENNMLGCYKTGMKHNKSVQLLELIADRSSVVSESGQQMALAVGDQLNSMKGWESWLEMLLLQWSQYHCFFFSRVCVQAVSLCAMLCMLMYLLCC